MNTNCTMPEHGQVNAPSACCRPTHAAAQVAPGESAAAPKSFIWRRAAQNTAVCLLGCTIGDVGVVMASWVWFPHAPMWFVMIAAIIAGLATSLALETAWLMRRGNLIGNAVRMAFAMSFVSMISMETAMNLVDLGLTGGNRMHLTLLAYAGILALGEVAGFLVPWPYNAWRLRYGRTCH